TSANGGFDIVASQAGNAKFYVDIRIPCWKDALKQCDATGIECDDPLCIFTIRKFIDQQYNYDPQNQRKVTFKMKDFNIATSKADTRTSVCE
ncbi:hypothetical protein PFISCL1PPCAC_5896, partial [Pristionchus fissidentatus]